MLDNIDTVTNWPVGTTLSIPGKLGTVTVTGATRDYVVIESAQGRRRRVHRVLLFHLGAHPVPEAHGTA